jgi:hypothetical protein
MRHPHQYPLQQLLTVGSAAIRQDRPRQYEFEARRIAANIAKLPE